MNTVSLDWLCPFDFKFKTRREPCVTCQANPAIVKYGADSQQILERNTSSCISSISVMNKGNKHAIAHVRAASPKCFDNWYDKVAKSDTAIIPSVTIEGYFR